MYLALKIRIDTGDQHTVWNFEMAAKISSKVKSAYRTIVSNRRAFRDYEILDTIEAGLVLTGTEIKSIRAGRANLQYSFARIDKGEVWLYNSHIAQYDQGNIYNHDPARPRKLLLHHRQILHLGSETGQKGLTLIPLRLYIRGHVAKIELGLAKGRRLYDKRKVIIDREIDREIGRTVSKAARG